MESSMNTEYTNLNKGALFPKSPETEKHPNYQGEINVDGKDYWISAWNKRSKAGNNFKSLSVTAKDDLKGKVDNTSDNDELSLDSIPF